MQSPTGAGRASGRPRLVSGSVVASRYVVEEFLGEGGGGQVYRALDRELDREVAIKLLHAHRARSPEAIARMRRETALAQTITDSSVCRVHDFGMGRVATPDDARPVDEFETVAYLSMELLRGETLARHVERSGPLEPAMVVSIGRQIARALRSAHRVGVIHGDVKPSNVMLVSSDDPEMSQRVVLTDFGLSRVEALDPAPPAAAPENGATSREPDPSSSIAGTPLCLAPEQVLGQPLTRATDVYSFGVVLYHLSSAAWPFEGRSRVGVALARLEQDPMPLLARQPSLANEPVLCSLVESCLQREPECRPEDMDEVLDRLETCLTGAGTEGSSGRVTGSTIRRVSPATLGAIVVTVVVLGLGLVAVLQPLPERRGGGTAAADALPGIPALPAFEPRGPTPEELLPSSSEGRNHWRRGLAALDAGDPSTAVRELSAAREATEGSNAMVWIELSRAWEMAGNERLALEAAEEAFALRDELPRGGQLLAEARLRIAQSDWSRAAVVLRALWEFYPDRGRFGYELAGVLDRDGRLEEAREVIGQVRERLGRDSAHLDLRESLVEYHLGDYTRSAELARSAAVLARASGARLLEAEAFDLEALTRSQTDTALHDVETLLSEAEQAFREVGHLAKVAAVNRRQGHIARRQGAFEVAERHYRAARSLAQESEDPATYAGATGDLALLFDVRGAIEDSLELKLEVLANYEERGVRQGAAITQENIGISLFKLGRLDEAMASMRAAEAEYVDLGDRIGIAWAPYHQGRLWSAMGRLELARRSFDLARAAASENEDETLEFFVRHEEAELDWMHARFESALEINRECAARYLAADQTRDRADADLQAARILASSMRWQDSVALAQQALDAYSGLGVEQGVVESRAVLLLGLLEVGQSSSARAQLEQLEAEGTEHGVARLRAAGAAAVARRRLELEVAPASGVGGAAARLDALRREATDLGLQPLAAELGLLRLSVQWDPALGVELREQATALDLLFIVDGLDALVSTTGVTDPARSSSQSRVRGADVGAAL